MNILHSNIIKDIVELSSTTILKVKNKNIYMTVGIRWNIKTFCRGPSYGSEGKESACSAGDTGDGGSIPESRRFLGEENGKPLWYFCLENSMDRGA